MVIVVGTDFSQDAKLAGNLAAKLARRLGDSLILVHAFEPWITSDADVVPPTWMDQAKEDAQQRLTSAGKELSSQGLHVETHLEMGLADQVLEDQATKTAPRFVVVGTHGRRGLQRLLVGSVANRLTQSVESPLLVLRRSNPGLLSWLEGQRHLRLMVAVDNTAATDSLISWVRLLRQQVACDVTFVHLYWPPGEHQRLGTAHQGAFVPDLEVLSVLRRDLGARIGTLPGKGDMSIVVRPQWGRMGDAIALLASELEPDLLVAGTRHHGIAESVLRGNTSRRILQCVNVPVALIPISAQQGQSLPDARKILVGTDFTAPGNAALQHAYGLLVGKGGTVDLVHVVAKEDASTEESLQTQLRSLIPTQAAASGIVTRVHILAGDDPAQELLQASARWGSHVVCVGSSGRSGLSRALVGSVTAALIAKAPVPVLVVREVERG